MKDYKDTALSPKERAQALLADMSLDEKNGTGKLPFSMVWN